MATVSLLSSDRTYTVSKILCIGRNYAAHAKEMQADIPASPVFFLKPPSAVIGDGGTVLIPPVSDDVHHEVEMTVLIGTGGKKITEDRALAHVAGYGVGLDLTLRDVQAEAKKKGLPWSLAKGFDTSAPLSAFVPASAVPDPSACSISLSVNGHTRQSGLLSDLLFPVPRLISWLSQNITLEPGDVIYTGTPEGVARIGSGDALAAELRGASGAPLVTLHVSVSAG